MKNKIKFRINLYKHPLNATTCEPEMPPNQCDTACKYFVEGENYFSSNGCNVVEKQLDYLICECNHLTDFSGFFQEFISSSVDALKKKFTTANWELFTEFKERTFWDN